MTTIGGVECHGPRVSFLNISFDPPARTRVATKLSEYQWLGAAPFIAVHLLPLLAFYTGTRWQDWACCVALYWVRMFGVTGVYHRYFSHRTYKTSRVFQFVLAFLAQTTAQKSVLWWAAKHRHHHLFSDTEHDVHSPRHKGFL
jgi:stearoyl-CoA desaturase (delta-9 desaturase)